MLRPGLGDETLLSSLVLPLLLACMGMLLITLWLRGVWRGTELRCAQCGYDVRGLPEQRCPECGAQLNDGMVVRGQRKRNLIVVGLGSLCILVAVVDLSLIVSQGARNVNWYHYRSARGLGRSARNGDRRALSELLRRAHQPDATSQHLSAVADLALDQQITDPQPPDYERWCEFLSLLAREDVLTPQQKDRFLEQVAVPWMKARARVLHGDPLIIRGGFARRGFRYFPLALHVDADEVRIDGAVVARGVYPRRDELLQDPWPELLVWSMEDTFGLPPGLHILEHEVAFSIFASHSSASVGGSLWRGYRKIALKVDVVPDNDPIRLVWEPSLEPVMARLFFGTPAQRYCSPQCTNLLVELTPLVAPPVDLAFEVLMAVGIDEFPMGSAHWAKGESSVHSLESGCVLGADGDAPNSDITIILRPSRSTAAKSLDCYEIWGRELRVHPVIHPCTRTQRQPRQRHQTSTWGG